MNYKNVKLWVGPMTQYIVDATIQFCDFYGINIGFIPSRRQIDYFGGYVSDWNTRSFSTYVRSKTPLCPIWRDHGGPKQGSVLDDGMVSLKDDCSYLDGIHLDPFKLSSSIEFTNRLIEECSNYSNHIKYEIGTEEAICKYSPEEMLNNLTLDPPRKKNLVYMVVQCGTSLKDRKNTGIFNENLLKDFLSVCRHFNFLSKEHNGDFQTIEEIKYKFSLGLNAINIAPEIAEAYNECLLFLLTKFQLKPFIDEWFNGCVEQGSWKKWFSSDFNPNEHRESLLIGCGHYFLNSRNLRLIQNQYKKELTKTIFEYLRKFLPLYEPT